MSYMPRKNFSSIGIELNVHVGGTKFLKSQSELYIRVLSQTLIKMGMNIIKSAVVSKSIIRHRSPYFS